VTGATGMLGRSLMRTLAQAPAKYEVVGTAFTRADGAALRKLDLRDEAAVAALMAEVAPGCVVHCAAERDPDKAASDPEGTRALNVGVSGALAAHCAASGAFIVYISTDYVFDGGVKTGVFAPYAPGAESLPLNAYGQSKRDGELAVLAERGAAPLVLRVPVLYAADSAELEESASLVVAKALLATESKKVDDWGVRFPTLVDDVAACIAALLDVQAGGGGGGGGGGAATGILHCSAAERTSKYKLALLMAKILGRDASLLVADSAAPGGAARPQNTELDCSATWDALGLSEPMAFTPLEEGMSRALDAFRQVFKKA